jgi:multiple sugar transport system permease protein
MTVTAAAALRRPRFSRARRREALFGLAFAAPVILGFLIFNIGPILASLGLAFTDYNILSARPDFVGLRNFSSALQDDLFYRSFHNTLYYTALRIPLSIAVAFSLANLVRGAGAGSTLYRSAIYVPSIVPSVGTAVVWLIVLNPQIGLLNRGLALIGIEGPGWLVSPSWSKPAIVLMNLWQTGGSFVIFLAGLQDIPRDCYEAANVDGASRWHSFWQITVPLMTPVVLFNLIMESIYAFQVFESAFITTGGGPLRSTYFMALYVYDNGFKFLKMGYASAISWIMFGMIMVFTAMLLRSSRNWVFYGGGR